MFERILKEKQNLESHPFLLGDNINNVENLRIFMETHVFAVWDFMSLLKSLQHFFVPSGNLWIPNDLNHSSSARLINEIILLEETDEDLKGEFSSHFELYLKGMEEIGANTSVIKEFIEILKTDGLEKALALESIPKEAREFMLGTFSFIESKKPHCIAAAFTFGRETVIPQMFIKILNQLNKNNINAPTLKYYLERHIFLDEEKHGPTSLKIVENLIKNEKEKNEVIVASLEAIKLRYNLWSNLSKRF